MEIKIQLQNADEIMRFLEARPERTREEINRAVKKSVIEVEREAKQRSPHKSGRMWGSIKHRQYELKGEVGVGVKYAIYFEAPYRKKPRKGGRGESEFFTNAIKSSENIINQFFQKAIANVLK